MSGFVEKPPLGLRPRTVALMSRRTEIYEAMARYLAANMVIPLEWLLELVEIEGKIDELKKRNTSLSK